MHTRGTDDGMDRAARESPSAYACADRAADYFEITAVIPVLYSKLLISPLFDIIVCLIDRRWLSVALTAGIQFQAVLTFGCDPFQLPHLM